MMSRLARLALVLLSSIAIGSLHMAPSASAAAKQLVISQPADAVTLDPHMHSAQETLSVLLNVFESLRRIIPEEHYEAAVAYRLELDYREILPHLKREPGIRRLVRRLKALGLPLAVNTNRMDTMPMVLSTVDLEGVFHPVMTSATVTRPKPDPEGVEKILAAWGLEPGEVAFLGDSSVDEATAKNAGVPFWAFKNPALQAELHVPDFPTLQRAFERAWPERGEAPGEHS